MFADVRRALSLLDARQRRHFCVVLIARLLASAGEFIGAGAVVPMIAILAHPEVIVSNEYLHAIHSFFGEPPLAQFVLYFAALVVVTLVLTNVLTVISLFLSARFAQRIAAEFAASLYRYFLLREYREIIGSHTADLVTRIIEFCPRICDGIILSSINLAARCFLIVVIVTVLLLTEARITLAASGLILGCYVAVYWTVKRRVVKLGRDNAEFRSALNKRLIESFGAVKVLRLYHLEQRMADEFRVGQKQLARNVADTNILGAIPYYLMEIVTASGIVMIAVYLSLTQPDFGQYVGVLTLFGVAAFRLLPACQRAYNDIGKIAGTGPVLDEVFDELRVAVTANSRLPDQSRRGFDFDAGIVFEHVYFAYASGAQVFDDFSLALPLCGVVELRGPSGCGKSTLMELLVGLLQPDNGRVVAAGVVLDPQAARAWQQQISYVPQNCYLLDDTIEYNVALTPHPDPAALKRALRLAGLEPLPASMPRGLHTRLGDNAALVSGGQRQRIGIARAIYRGGSVLLLDEALSSLDLESAQQIMLDITAEACFRSIIHITHRDKEIIESSRVIELPTRAS